jgi:membrane dipeptidase
MSNTSSTEPGRWDFGLSAAEEARAARLHADCIIVDGMHQHPGGPGIFAELPADEVAKVSGGSDFAALGMAQALPYRLCLEGKTDIVRRWWRESGMDVGTLLVPTGPGMKAWGDALAILRNLDWIKPVTTVAEIRRNKRLGIISLWGYDQPVFGIPNSLDSVEDAYRRGLRTLMLTYNRMDYVGAGCTERYDVGLSMYGLDVVRKCNELGIIVDTSHCGRQTTLDACEFSKTPVIANHAAAKGVYAHRRGKSDEELKAIAASGGFIGIVVVPSYVSADPQASIEHMLDHIDYVARTVGWQHVGLGTDWPMQNPPELLARTLGPEVAAQIGFKASDRVVTDMMLRGFRDYRDAPNITRGLVKRGYSDDQIAGILGENHLRVMERVCG